MWQFAMVGKQMIMKYLRLKRKFISGSKGFFSCKCFCILCICSTSNIQDLHKENKSITLEPGNQIELSGAPLVSIHQNCSESYEFLDELKKACKK